MESSIPSIQWFPGHMAKTRRLMAQNMKLVDLVVELRDARIPYSSANPEIEKLAGGKPRVLLLGKSDMADAAVTTRWRERFAKEGLPAAAVDCRSGKGVQGVRPLVESALSDLIRRRSERGMAGRPLRLMVVGVPNVGKSSFINRVAQGKRAKVEDRPGVTRGKQWVKVNGGMELLDMPGVLWPKFEDPRVGEHLAFTGAVKDDVVDIEALAARLLERLWRGYPDLLEKRYKFTAGDTEGLSGYGLLELLCKKRGMLLPGGGYNLERGAAAALDEFRAGTIGRISLETPEEVEQWEREAGEPVRV